jgi:Ni2+-binding GTPase involved in maturation of urease and hydrogenase
VLNKADIVKLDELSPEKRAQLAPIVSEDIPLMEMSTVTEQGIMEVKQEVRPSSHALVSKSLCSHNFCSLLMSPEHMKWSGLIVFSVIFLVHLLWWWL